MESKKQKPKKRIYSNAFRGTYGFKVKPLYEIMFTREQEERMDRAYQKFKEATKPKVIPKNKSYYNPVKKWNGLTPDEL
jgi:hypothetical protein